MVEAKVALLAVLLVCPRHNGSHQQDGRDAAQQGVAAARHGMGEVAGRGAAGARGVARHSHKGANDGSDAHLLHRDNECQHDPVVPPPQATIHTSVESSHTCAWQQQQEQYPIKI